MIILQYVVPFVLLIGILVFFHELGHFLAARACGMRADVFAIGMGPRLFGWNKKTGFTFGKVPDDLDLNGGTDYRLSAFPIGGYVKIAGMVDESMDTDFSQQEAKPWEFRSKNMFQKSLVISAGVIMNFLLAIVVLAGVYSLVGVEVWDTNTVGAVPATSPAYAAGVLPGDKIVAVDGQKISYFQEITNRVLSANGQNVVLTVDRHGAPLTLTIPSSALTDVRTQGASLFYAEKTAVVIEGVADKSPAERGGLKAQDVVVAINGAPAGSIDEFRRSVASNAGKPLALLVKRNGVETAMTVTPGSDGLLGVQIQGDYQGQTKRLKSSIGEALSIGYKETAFLTTQTFAMVGNLFTGKAKLGESVGGPLAIAKLAKQQAARGLDDYLRLLAMISVALACMDILPIPALDGGHLAFILVEGIIRREVPMKVRVAIQQVGFALLLLFFVFVFYNDATKLFK